MYAHPPRIPSYRHHKPSGQAVVTLNGHDVYLGRHDSAQSRAEYDRIIAEWLANGRQLAAPADITIAELIPRHVEHVSGQYRSDEPDEIRQALRQVRIRYGSLQAREFGPLKLKTLRQEWIDKNLVRGQINKRIPRIVRMFRWAVAEEILPVDTRPSRPSRGSARAART